MILNLVDAGEEYDQESNSYQRTNRISSIAGAQKISPRPNEMTSARVFLEREQQVRLAKVSPATIARLPLLSLPVHYDGLAVPVVPGDGLQFTS